LIRTARRLLPALTLVALILPASASASGGNVSHAQATKALEAAQALFQEPLSTAGAPSRDATTVLRDLAVAMPALNRAERRQGRRILQRPTDKGARDYFGKEAPDSPVCSPNFCVHWTDKGKNAPTSQAFLNEVGASVETSYAVENGTLGWKRAKSDGKHGERHGQGGQGQVDVYVTNLGKSLYGYAAPDPGQQGSKRYAYLVLDNDYVGFPSPPIESLKVTVAHEYNHILQFNYDTFEDVWLFESTATWSEQQVYPDINDYLNYLPSFAKGSESPMTSAKIKIYSEAVWNHFLTAKFGPEVIRDTWAASAAGVKPKHLATAAYTKSLGQHGGAGFSTELGEFFAATAEWQSSPLFPDSAVYPPVRRHGKAGAKTQKVTLDNTSFRLADVSTASSAPITLKVKAPKGVASTLALVGRVGPEDAGAVTTQVAQLPKGGTGTVTLDNPSQFNRVTAVIANTDGFSNRFSRKGRIYPSDNSKYKYSVK
jgi:hypothetical protein